MGTYDNSFNTSRDYNTGETPRKGLLINMGVVKNSGPQNGTIFPYDIPFISIVFPSGIFMENGNTKMIGVFAKFLCINLNDICFSCIWSRKMQK